MRSDKEWSCKGSGAWQCGNADPSIDKEGNDFLYSLFLGQKQAR